MMMVSYFPICYMLFDACIFALFTQFYWKTYIPMMGGFSSSLSYILLQIFTCHHVPAWEYSFNLAALLPDHVNQVEKGRWLTFQLTVALQCLYEVQHLSFLVFVGRHNFLFLTFPLENFVGWFPTCLAGFGSPSIDLENSWFGYIVSETGRHVCSWLYGSLPNSSLAHNFIYYA